jgi:H+/Na+-translocating ferredoxin:NAD+ oxidoreductase subunit B
VPPLTATAGHIDALLPQTQCTRCGFPTCKAYAAAIAAGTADIDRCPPGGAAGIAALAVLLERAVKPLDPACGEEAPPTVARIDEDVCIGCTKCIQACPVDAIVGSAKRMHTVIEAECTGCGLCLPPCPVDCIVLEAIAPAPLERAAVLARAARSRARFEARAIRIGAHAMPPRPSSAVPSGPPIAADLPTHPTPAPTAATLSRADVLAAIERGRARRASRASGSR